MAAIYGIPTRSPHVQRMDTDLEAMSAALGRRAPDGDTRWLDATDGAALGFRFLRTASGEASPGILANEDRSLLMVCDGHVFNSGTLRSYLRDKGHMVAQSHSCELLLHLYEEEGIAGWRRADGQFAMALWDRRTRRLVLGRDFLGVRPLYCWRTADGLVFASEIKASRRSRYVPCAVHESALADFRTFTSVPGPRTLFQDVRKVPAGSAVIRAADGTVRVETYWDLLQDPIAESGGERFYVDRVRALHRT